MIYLDNAATSFPKPRSVIAEVQKYIRRDCGNPGRSGHRLAARAAEAVYLAREEIADFFGARNPERVIFTVNATHALNLAIKSQIMPFCHVLCSDLEHNSVIRPLERLRRDIGIEYSCFSLEGDIYANLSEAVRDNTKAIVCTMSSNVTGKKSRRSGAITLCKGARTETDTRCLTARGARKNRFGGNALHRALRAGAQGTFRLSGVGIRYF